MVGALVMAFLRNGSQQMGWPMPMVAQVMEEYRKFLFLAMRAGAFADAAVERLFLIAHGFTADQLAERVRVHLRDL